MVARRDRAVRADAPEALRGDDQNTLFHPSEVELAETTKAVVDLCARVKPKRLVFDSLSEIRLLAAEPAPLSP